MEDYLVGIGKRIKEIRKSNGQTIHTLASKADVSNGLISRIENGRTIPSLPVLLSIIKSLEIDVPEFFSGLPQYGENNFFVCRSADFSVIEKEEDAEGFVYKLIFGKQLASMGFEAVMLEVQPGSKRDKVKTDAFEFKYMISGECSYIISEEEVLLQEGDAIFFDGRIPHVPVNNASKPAKMLVFYFFINNEK
ncbi:XRE family transcriptional regulator [Echinicola sp. 20G]|uniref:helix-turn-helix domain-containing protein n=1 Tax=Echinicola sp. 20G TaxID=2781961 RepID=UPI00191021BE|nr:XRE family transcriptional regulator [Echinicola sp. 20G]